MCQVSSFENDECPSDTQVGTDELTVFASRLANTTIAALRLQPPTAGRPTRSISAPRVPWPLVANEHIFLEGHVSWNTDYHEYFRNQQHLQSNSGS